jgi:CRISPR type III-B/RAMP module RAMP protein Cmr6
MPSLLNSTKEALGGEALPHCQSRALRLTRYARPELNDESQPTRHDFLQSVAAAQRTEAGLDSWRTWLGTAAKPEHTIHAKLEARLLINMGGTVLENAGLQLDRFGTAYLPGSAVKACARRTVVAALRQWCETGTKPEAASDDALAPICAPFSAPIDLLLAIVRVFGCTDLEWQGYDYEENKGNDLAWACAKQWPVLCDQVRAILNRDTSTPEETAPTRRGCVAFLPAYPHTRPAADLELDVLTSHHPKYYGGDLDIATDTENPIPVYFPAVTAGAIYTFALLPVGNTDATTLSQARSWLKTGLELFGLGAKTAAGYGYFSDATAEIAAKQAKDVEAKRLAAEEAARKEKQAADLAARKEIEAQRAAMTPEQRADAELADHANDWGWMKQNLAKFPSHKPEAQAAILRWFNGAGKSRWLDEIKPEAAKGKKPWSQIIGAIHAAKKTHKIDLP